MDIKDATLKDLVNHRFDLIEAILAGEHEGSVNTSAEQDINGAITKWIEEKRDLNGVLVSKRVDDYIYNQIGNIDEISLKWYNKAGDLNLEKIVKHSIVIKMIGKK